MVPISNRPSRSRTVSIAPSAPGMPYLTPPPSKAGPAGLEAARIVVPSEATISLFVPMSTSRNDPPRAIASTATRSAAASAPTWLAMSGPPVTRACGLTSSPSSCARRTTLVAFARPSRTAVSVTGRMGSGRSAARRARRTGRAWWGAHDVRVHKAPSLDAQLRAQALQLVVERAPERKAQLARELVLVRDAGHDVRAAEALGVLQGCHGEDPTALEIHELDHDGRGADVERDADRAARRGTEVRAIVCPVPAVLDPDGRVRRRDVAPGLGCQQDPQPPPQDRELQVSLGTLHPRLAGEPERRAQERLLVRACGELVAARPHLHDALVASARPPAGRRDDDRELVCIVVEQAAGDEGALLRPVDHMGHPGKSRGRQCAAGRSLGPFPRDLPPCHGGGSGPDAGTTHSVLEVSVGSLARNPVDMAHIMARSPRYDRMTPADCTRLHDASLSILERTGVMLRDDEAVERLHGAGARVGNDGRVHVPGSLVDWALSVAPRSVTLFDRSGSPRLALEGDNAYFGPGSDCMNIIDHRTGERRKAVLADTRDGLAVVDALPNMDFGMSMFLPSDVPAEMADRHQMAVMLRQTVKPLVVVTYDVDAMVDAVEMAEAVAGGREALRARPTIALYINVTRGLVQNGDSLRKLLFLAERGLPAMWIR